MYRHKLNARPDNQVISELSSTTEKLSATIRSSLLKVALHPTHPYNLYSIWRTSNDIIGIAHVVNIMEYQRAAIMKLEIFQRMKDENKDGCHDS